MKTYISKNPETTMHIGEGLSNVLEKGDIIALEGDIGAGKTCFVKGLAKGLGISDIVSSPTYSIINEYKGKLKLCHCDMYRIDNISALECTGFFDYLEDNFIIAIEWSENIKEFLPNKIITVKLENINENTRKIIISGDEKIENIGD